MKTIILMNISWVDSGMSTSECLCTSTAVCLKDSIQEDTIEKALDNLEAQPDVYSLTVNKFEVTVDDEQADSLMNDWNNFNPNDYI